MTSMRKIKQNRMRAKGRLLKIGWPKQASLSRWYQLANRSRLWARQGKNISGRSDHQCKGPVAGNYLISSRNRKRGLWPSKGGECMKQLCFFFLILPCSFSTFKNRVQGLIYATSPATFLHCTNVPFSFGPYNLCTWNQNLGSNSNVLPSIIFSLFLMISLPFLYFICLWEHHDFWCIHPKSLMLANVIAMKAYHTSGFTVFLPECTWNIRLNHVEM